MGDLTEADDRGWDVLRHICDKHIATSQSISKFGKIGGPFVKDQRRKLDTILSLIRLLLEKGADLNRADHAGNTILQDAVESADDSLIELLRAHGARSEL